MLLVGATNAHYPREKADAINIAAPPRMKPGAGARLFLCCERQQSTPSCHRQLMKADAEGSIFRVSI
jgi:hypothetical protein